MSLDSIRLSWERFARRAPDEAKRLLDRARPGARSSIYDGIRAGLCTCTCHRQDYPDYLCQTCATHGCSPSKAATA